MQLFNGHTDIVSDIPLENDPITIFYYNQMTPLKQRNNKIWPIDNATDKEERDQSVGWHAT